jgi:hypothetical protein
MIRSPRRALGLAACFALAACGDGLAGDWKIEPADPAARRAFDLAAALAGDATAAARLDPGGEAALAWAHDPATADHPDRAALAALGPALAAPALTLATDHAIVHADAGPVRLERRSDRLYLGATTWTLSTTGPNRLTLTPADGGPPLRFRR